jgi:hypothetical protein
LVGGDGVASDLEIKAVELLGLLGLRCDALFNQLGHGLGVVGGFVQNFGCNFCRLELTYLSFQAIKTNNLSNASTRSTI